jgi:hypothetical protein
MSRRHSYLDEDFPLPWPLEVAFWVFGLICGLLAMWWLTSEIISRAETLGTMLGVHIESRSFVDSAQPLIWLFGFVVFVRVRCWLRRIVVNSMNKAF